MSNNFDHNQFEKDFFSNSEIKYSKSKDEVWAEMEKNMNTEKSAKVIRYNFRKIISYSSAAILVIGISILSILRFHTTTIYCPNGQHSLITLPDNSKVTLNANTEISYHPYWWKYKRTINFNGEAFFEVQKGSSFNVVSNNGETTVLGTSFNIFAREEQYKVHCITGKVKVETKGYKSIILTPNEYSYINKKNNSVKKEETKSPQKSISWINNEFSFENTSLLDAYKEIERQFDVTIIGKEKLKGVITVNVKRGSSVEEIINIIGKPNGVSCQPISNKKYNVSQ